MSAARYTAVLALILLAAPLWAQGPAGPPTEKSGNPWQYSLTMYGYIVPSDVSYGDPVFTADHRALHLEARYNYENVHTASLWAGCNFVAGTKLVFTVTPMLGAVFGRTNGVAPEVDATLTYRKFQASMSNEYVFDLQQKSGNFYYAWPQLTYSPLGWLHLGVVAQHTKAYQTPVSTQRGFLVGFSHKRWEVTTYVLNPFITDPILVLEAGISF